MTRQGQELGPLDPKLTLKPLSHHITNLFGHVSSQQIVDERVVSSTNHGQLGILPTSWTHTKSWYPVTPQDQDSQVQSQQYPQQCYTYRCKTISVVTFAEEKTDEIIK